MDLSVAGRGGSGLASPVESVEVVAALQESDDGGEGGEEEEQTGDDLNEDEPSHADLLPACDRDWQEAGRETGRSGLSLGSVGAGEGLREGVVQVEDDHVVRGDVESPLHHGLAQRRDVPLLQAALQVRALQIGEWGAQSPNYSPSPAAAEGGRSRIAPHPRTIHCRSSPDPLACSNRWLG